MSIHDALTMQWDSACKKLEAAKKEEKQLRELLLHNAFNFKAEELRDGNDKLLLGRGWLLKAQFGTTYKLKDNVQETLNKIAQISSYHAHALVKWKPELVTSEYKGLQIVEVKGLIDSVLEMKPASPQLKLVEPKGKE